MRLLKVEKMISANRPGARRIAVTLPRKSSALLASGSGVGAPSGMRMKSRCTKVSTIAPIAIARVHPMPRKPIERPENTLVTRNARPCTVPTSPFALARFSSGTSSVTVVDSAMLRSCSITPPNRMIAENSQNHGPPRSSSAASGCQT